MIPIAAVRPKGLVASSVFQPGAATFDGTNDYMTRGAPLTGVVDHNQGIFSAWVNIDGGDGAYRVLLMGASSKTAFYLTDANKFYIGLTSDAGTEVYIAQSSSGYVAADVWRHVLISWDTNFGAASKICHLYVDGVSTKSVAADTNIAFVSDYDPINWGIGGGHLGASKLPAKFAELYFAPAQFLDFSVSANRLKFRDAAGKPADLGADGSAATGVAPAMYHSIRPGDAVTAFATNRGTGGNFSITGTLVLATGPAG